MGASSGAKAFHMEDAARSALGQIKSTAKQHNDLGSQGLATGIETSLKAYSVVKFSQNAAPVVVNVAKQTPKTIAKVGKGTWEVCSFAGRLTITVVNTAAHIKTGVVSLNKDALYMLRAQAKATGLDSTLIARRIIYRVLMIKRAIDNAKRGYEATKRFIRDTYRIVRIVVHGRMTAQISHNLLKKVKNKVVTGIKTVAVHTGKAAYKGAKWTIKKGVPKTYKVGKKVAVSAYDMTATALTRTDDYALQGVGYTLIGVKYGVKTAVNVGKATAYSVKTGVKVGVKTAKVGVKTVKGLWKAVQFVQKNGLRASLKMLGKLTLLALKLLAQAAVKMIIKVASLIGVKILLPLLILGTIIFAIIFFISGPVSTLMSIFSGTFSSTEDEVSYTDYDVREFLSDTEEGVPALREKYINNLVNELNGYLVENGGSYHYVRIYKGEDEEKTIDCTYEAINSSFYSAEQMMNIIQPIFNATIAMDYELSPTETQAKERMEEIFNSLFSHEMTSTVEYCGQLEDGLVPTCVECGKTHADISSCPNMITGIHGSYTCPSCCYLVINEDGDEEHTCNGYHYCGGHQILIVKLNMDGVHGLLQKYFLDPIEKLSNKEERTKEEEEKLQEYKDFYDICLELIKEVGLAYGGGMSIEDLAGIEWVFGSRAGNQAIIDIALAQVGQMGGQPYWSWYGFEKRVEWCACFVSWCLNQSGYSEPRFASCHYQGVPYFKSRGLWEPGGFTDLAPGDVIFFDWECDGISDHVGLVIGRDESYVYTVEGNSGDVCRVKAYSLDSSVIYGYGKMSY